MVHFKEIEKHVEKDLKHIAKKTKKSVSSLRKSVKTSWNKLDEYEKKKISKAYAISIGLGALSVTVALLSRNPLPLLWAPAMGLGVGVKKIINEETLMPKSFRRKKLNSNKKLKEVI